MSKFRALLLRIGGLVGVLSAIAWLVIPTGHLLLRVAATVLMLTWWVPAYLLARKPHAQARKVRRGPQM